MPRLKETKQVINKIVINVHGGKVRCDKDRRAKLRRKLTQNKKLAPAPREHRLELPADVDLDDLTQHGNLCIATARNGLFVTHDPVVRFIRRLVTTSGRAKVHDFIYFDPMAWKVFGLKAGMQLALFTDRAKDPRYLIIQNVTGVFEAPAHLHRFGMFTLYSSSVTGDGQRNHDHVLKPGTFTPRGFIRNSRSGRYPLALFANFPTLLRKWGRLYRVRGRSRRTDLLLVQLEQLHWISSVMPKRATRPQAGLVEPNLKLYDVEKRATVRLAV